MNKRLITLSLLAITLVGCGSSHGGGGASIRKDDIKKKIEAKHDIVVEDKNTTHNHLDLDVKETSGMSEDNGRTIVNNGRLNLSKEGQIGMSINGKGTAINKGYIMLNGGDQTGMYADGDGAKIINRGTIDVKGGAIGMYATNNGVIENYGKIYLSGKKDSTDASGYSDTHGNKAIVPNGGRVVNKGEIIFKNK